MQRAAGGDDIIHDQDALAIHILDVLLVDDKLLLALCGDGLVLNDDRLTHIQLRAFACRDPVFAALACHFIGQRNTLGLGGQNHIKLRRLFQQSSGAGLGQLHIAEHDKSSNVQVIIDLADGQFTGQARDMQCIGICHDGFTSPYFYKCATAFGISPEAMQGCAWPAHESAGASRSGRRPHPHW